MSMKPDELIERGRRVVRLEREALEEVERRARRRVRAARWNSSPRAGRVIVERRRQVRASSRRKIAATLTSTGTPAMFLHPMESVHGDLGIVGPTMSSILLSKSGETQELFPLIEQLKRLGVRSVAITGEGDSHAREPGGRRARRLGARGSVPARPRADHEHDRGARAGRRARRGAARGEGIPSRGFRAAAPGRALGKPAPLARARSDGHRQAARPCRGRDDARGRGACSRSGAAPWPCSMASAA